MNSYILLLGALLCCLKMQEECVLASEDATLENLKEKNENPIENDAMESSKTYIYRRKLMRGSRPRLPRQGVSLRDMYTKIMFPPLESRDFSIHEPSSVLLGNNMQMIAVAGRPQEDGYDCGIETWYRSAYAEDAWQPGQCLFQYKPNWIAREMPGQDGAFVAPELISDSAMLFSVSNESAGRSNSCVGVAKGVGELPNEISWRDSGKPIICFNADQHGVEQNVIGPSAFTSFNDKSYLVTGKGIIIATELDEEYMPVSGSWYPDRSGAWQELARGPVDPFSESGYGWVEAAYVHPNRIQGYYYLFVNWGKCCDEIDSTYEIRVGRSRRPLGPYLDKDGVDMMEGGGTFFLGSDQFFLSPGHLKTMRNGFGWAFTFHYYDERRDRKPWVAECILSWRDGWPITGDFLSYYGTRIKSKFGPRYRESD